jgi:hypothetical protein
MHRRCRRAGRLACVGCGNFPRGKHSRFMPGRDQPINPATGRRFSARWYHQTSEPRPHAGTQGPRLSACCGDVTAATAGRRRRRDALAAQTGARIAHGAKTACPTTDARGSATRSGRSDRARRRD